MGKCWNCETEITLQEEDTRCDNCGEIIRYFCHNCFVPFDIENKETRKKLKECKTCGFFICPTCGVCGDTCLKKEWVFVIRKILEPEITHLTISNLSEKLQKILDYIEEIKIGKEQRNCFKEVPISYAKNRIKSCIARTEGYRTKDFIDKAEFRKRLQKIMEFPIGYELTVEQIRENGNYGQEFRDVLNTSICYGWIKVLWRKSKEGKKYALYGRIDGQPCSYLNAKDLFFQYCDKCKRRFPIEKERCSECTHKKNSKHYQQGEYHKLKLKLTNRDICQYPRGDFKRREVENGSKNS